MPTKEYKCPHCGHNFKRVVFQDDEETPVNCPKCRYPKVETVKETVGLFKGISSFSALSKDTN